MRVLAFLALLGLALGQDRTLVVNTNYGQLRGKVIDMNGEAEVTSFLGIPYAKPPVGERRFTRPEKPDSWTGIREATSNPSSCPQNKNGDVGFVFPHWDNWNEDCLYLNVFTPYPLNSLDRNAVMVWLHGGAYRSGGSIMYPGHFYAMKGVVLVSVNYRIGCLGFATSGDDTATGNYGLWDQRQSLIWVRENIANFGGDPNKVTLFGQSAGGSSAGLHLLSPSSEGLFQQVIAMSGSDQVPWAFNPQWLPPERYTQEVATAMNCTYSTPAEMITCLRTKSADDIAGYREEPISGWVSQGFGPVIDGATGFLPDNPYTLRENRQIHKRVRIMSGHTTQDGSGYLLPFVPEAVDGYWNETMHQYLIRHRMVDWVYARDPVATQERVSGAMIFQYTDWPYTADEERNRQILVQGVTDVGFGAGQDILLKTHAEFNTTFEYLQGYRVVPLDDLVPRWMGTLHGADIPLAFAYTRYPDYPDAQDDAELWSMSLFDMTQPDKDNSDFLITLFTNFAKDGHPTLLPVTSPGGTEVTWLPFTNENLNYLSIGQNDVENGINLHQRRNAFWREYAHWLAPPPKKSEYKLKPTIELKHKWDFTAEQHLRDVIRQKMEEKLKAAGKEDVRREQVHKLLKKLKK